MAGRTRTQIHSSPEWVTYATIAADKDLVTERPGYSKADGGDGNELLPREIHVLGSGDLVVELRDGTSDTIAGIIAPWVLPIQAAKIESTGTTATKITVFW